MCEKFLHAVNCVAGRDWRRLNLLREKFGNWRYVWEKAGIQELTEAGVGKNFAERLVAARRLFDADAEFAGLWERDIVPVSRSHREYPKALLPLADAPFLLYRKGAALNTHHRMVAIVGTRNPSTYGEKIAYDLAEALAAAGVTVVSGLAFGIDAIAHFAAVSSQKPTIGVLASGLFDITPSSHHRLSEKILEYGGALVSEYPPSNPAYPHRFLERNRIIAGLCEATVVIEAGKISGALVTARLANEYNRDVYALPGDITRQQSAGCLGLIRDGAHPLVSIADFLERLGLNRNQTPDIKFSAEEKIVLSCFSPGPRSTDHLAEETQLPIEKLNILLTDLEMKRAVGMNAALLWELSGPFAP